MYFYVQREQETQVLVFHILESFIFFDIYRAEKNAIISKENVDDDDIYTTHIFFAVFWYF